MGDEFVDDHEMTTAENVNAFPSSLCSILAVRAGTMAFYSFSPDILPQNSTGKLPAPILNSGPYKPYKNLVPTSL